MEMGLDRRSILKGGLAGAGALYMTGGGTSLAAALGLKKSHVVVETAVAESRYFAAAYPDAAAIKVGSDLNGFIAQPLPAGIIVGLTSDPLHMMTEQLILERGGQPLFRWRHSYAAGQWHHEIEATTSEISGAGSAWPAEIARAVASRLERCDTDQKVTTTCSVPGRLARRSPSVLMTWGYKMPAAAL